MTADDIEPETETYVPVLEPSPDFQQLPHPQLDEGQKQKLEALRAHIVPQLLPDTDEYHEMEKTFLSDSTLQRYLRARKWDLEGAKKQLDGSIQWRRSYKPDLIDPKEVEPESLTGKTYLNGFDKHGHPTLYLKPRNENTKPSTAQIRNVVFNLEHAARLMPEGVDSLNIIVDMAGSSATTSPGLGIAKQFLDVLGNHYPERLGLAFVVHSPWFFWPFFRLVSPFIDPITRSKIKFVDLKHKYDPTKVSAKEHEWVNLLEYYTPEQLEKDFGGSLNFKWDFAKYWQTLLDKTGNPF